MQISDRRDYGCSKVCLVSQFSAKWRRVFQPQIWHFWTTIFPTAKNLGEGNHSLRPGHDATACFCPKIKRARTAWPGGVSYVVGSGGTKQCAEHHVFFVDVEQSRWNDDLRELVDAHRREVNQPQIVSEHLFNDNVCALNTSIYVTAMQCRLGRVQEKTNPPRNLGLSKYCWKVFLSKQNCTKMQTLRLKTPLFKGKVKFLSIYHLLYGKFAVVCQNSVGKLQLPALPIF